MNNPPKAKEDSTLDAIFELYKSETQYREMLQQAGFDFADFKAAIEAHTQSQIIEELESLRSLQGGHNLDEECCELCDRIQELGGKP